MGTDGDLRGLERDAAADPDNTEALGRFRAGLVRSGAFRVCDDCKLHVPELNWQRYRYDHEWQDHMEAEWLRIEKEIREDLERRRRERLEYGPRTDEASDQGGMTVVLAPFTGVLALRPQKVPLWHRIIVKPGQNRVSFFANTREGQTNLQGSGAHLPHANHFWLYTALA